ncbi:MAG TPA: hypothetical protein DEQ61_21025 [Streptomyces sp.]|nr:hypothetical protein [Streptomyces sp.]
MNTTRRSYEAQVLLVPLGPDAARTQETFAAQGLDGVMTVLGVTAATAADGSRVALGSAPVGNLGWRPAAGNLDAPGLVDDADMVVLLATDLAEVPAALCHAVAGAARDRGALIATLVIGSANWDTPRGSTAMAALRGATDMLVVVRGAGLAVSFLDVLRGGARAPATVP